MTEIPPPAAEPLDDAAVEIWLAGGPVPPGFEPVAEVLADLVACADQLQPTPNDALARLLQAGAPVAAEPQLVDLTDRRSRRARRAGTATTLAVALALTSVGAAAAAGGLPPTAQNAVSRVVRDFTPFSVPTAPAHHPAHPAAQPLAEPSASSAGPGADSSGPQDPLTPAAREGDDRSVAPTEGHGVPGSGDTADDSARPQTSRAVQAEPDSGAAISDGTAPGAPAPEPADSPATGSAVRTDPAASAAPSDDQATPSPAPGGTTDTAPGGTDASPGN